MEVVKFLNPDMNSVEQNSNPKQTRLKRKPHRTVARGLKLLSDVLKAVKANTKVALTRVEKGELDQEEFIELQNELPYDLFIHEILSRLPFTCLLQLKSVSKEWYSTVSSHEFANAHFRSNFSSYHSNSPVECLFIQVGNTFFLLSFQEEAVVLNYSLVKLESTFDERVENDIHLVGSCNGLVCLAASSDHFYIWNPVTYDLRKFSDLCFMPCNSITSWGFVYVSSEDDYKVVKIVQDYETSKMTIHMFSFKTQKWKHIHEGGRDDQYLSLTNTHPGVLVNDRLYWIMNSRGPYMKQVVVGFNLLLEKFEEIPSLVPRNVNHSFLCVLGGCLSLYNTNSYKEASLSISKAPEAVESINFSRYKDMSSCSGMVGFTRSGKAVVVSNVSELSVVALNSSPAQHSLLVNFDKACTPCIVSYVPSLISPFAITEM